MNDWSRQVFVCLQAVSTSLPAYDGRYHSDCLKSFRNIPKNSTNSISSKPLIEEPLQVVVNHIKSNKCTATWTIAELHNVYVEASGDLTKKQMLFNLSEYYGEELVLINVPGCETEIGLNKYVCTKLKMARKSMAEVSDDVDDIVRRIKSEVASIPTPCGYDLSDFCFNKTVKDTSETLLTLISKLISGSAITKKEITLAQ